MALAKQTNTTYNPARKLTRYYLGALSFVAIFVLGSQIWLQYTMANMEESARIINVAGRQRMLSQNIAKNVLLLRDESQSAERATVFSELVESFQDWQEAHTLLSTQYRQNQAIDLAFQGIEASYAMMATAVRRVVSSGGVVDGETIAVVRQSERQFLAQMENIVRLYEEEVYRIGSLRDTELAMAVIALFILLVEALFIFRPLTRLIGRQFSDLSKAHQELDLAKQKVEQASVFKTQFISYLSHEIRNPVGAIAGYAEVMLNGQLEPEKRKRFLRVIGDNCNHLSKLTNDALDAARIESGHLDLTVESCDPRQMINSVVLLMEPVAARKGLSLNVAFVEPIPASIATDSTRLRQILINLLANAIKFTQTGGVSLRVFSAESQTLAVQVIDTGIGMTQSQVAGLFQLFNRLKVVGNEGGTGIGLAVSRQLAQFLGGDLEVVASAPGHGSTFLLRISTRLEQPEVPRGFARELGSAVLT